MGKFQNPDSFIFPKFPQQRNKLFVAKPIIPPENPNGEKGTYRIPKPHNPSPNRNPPRFYRGPAIHPQQLELERKKPHPIHQMHKSSEKTERRKKT